MNNNINNSNINNSNRPNEKNDIENNLKIPTEPNSAVVSSRDSIDNKQPNQSINMNNNNNLNNSQIKGQPEPKKPEIHFLTSSDIVKKNEINLLLLGHNKVGKTSFIHKITENNYDEVYNPSQIIEKKSKVFSYNTHMYRINFHASPINEDYCEILQQFKYDFIIILFDLTDVHSFDIAVDIFNKIISITPLQMFNKETPNIYLVANKLDLSSQREVHLENIDNFCNEHQIKFFEISVKNSRNVNKMVQSFVKAFDGLAYPENSNN